MSSHSSNTPENKSNREHQQGVTEESHHAPATVAIARALAGVPDTGSSLAIDRQPLYDYVDTDALDTLIRNTPATTHLHVQFHIDRRTVHVSSDGTVLVE